jgi:hypothetical protein
MFTDEKERYDPVGFRDAIISGLDQCGNNFEAISRFLDGAGNKQDYRRYGESLFDILIAGGILGEHFYSHVSCSVINSCLQYRVAHCRRRGRHHTKPPLVSSALRTK